MIPNTSITAIIGGTIIDGQGSEPIENGTILVQGERIVAVGDSAVVVPAGARTISALGKFIIPGLMDANVHLLADIRLENLIRNEHRYEDLIAEASQVALKSGLTTVFDTYGPRRPLMAVRDKIKEGSTVGSRIFCAGNIIGLDGPYSMDFLPHMLSVASAAEIEKINALWVENVGPELSWMTPDQVAGEVRRYLAKGVDFIKYASSEHRLSDPSTFLLFSPLVQVRIVEEAHRSGITAQAHTTSVESLRVAVEAGCDVIQHCNISGPTLIPESTLEMITLRATGAVVFPFTRRFEEWFAGVNDGKRTPYICLQTMAQNCRNLIDAGATLLLGTDANIVAPEIRTDPQCGKFASAPDEDNLFKLGMGGHFAWFQAMEELGCSPMNMLQAATRNIAAAYRVERDLGTLEEGKVADILVLEKNPLLSASNYRSIHTVIKSGAVIDRSTLPQSQILTGPPEAASAEVLEYRNRRRGGESRFPFCC